MAATATIQIGGGEGGYIAPNIYTATAAPTIDNGTLVGHNLGDQIINTVTGAIYECVDNTAGAAVWNELAFKGEAQTVAISAAAGAANISLVTFQVKDAEGANVAAVFDMLITLSDAATGAGLTATTASGPVAVGANGADLGDLTAKKAKWVQTDATGKYILSITDTAKTLFYPVVQAPGIGGVVVGARLTVGNYG